ncbi:MAG: type II toxin-antitoxin system VapC family toxin [Saprospiraceae bacterium]|nr:type II toxin-antitoxin system VapC family toxin [Saprospiraceae bacterium]
MKYILDTNIFISLVRNNDFSSHFNRIYRKRNDVSFTSVVVEGELKAFAMQRKWENKRLKEVQTLLQKTVIAPIKTEEIISAYAEIDAYSQGKHPTLNLPTSARNMGKNDIWIAATASALELTLITTDKDFDHLNDVFLDVIWIDITDFSNL